MMQISAYYHIYRHQDYLAFFKFHFLDTVAQLSLYSCSTQ